MIRRKYRFKRVRDKAERTRGKVKKAPGKRGPGRPKGSRNQPRVPKEDLSGVRLVKFLGYCTCSGMIVKADLVSKRVYVCPGCGIRAILSSLKLTLNREPPSSKKEYMENTVNAQHLDTPPLLKVIEEMPGVEVIQEDEHEDR